ncbi:hypothetical protein [Nostoc sp. ChiQUE01b]|uniref:hypothetical protein n=1 Tax=Nostoc sp. ChiQUE01b TaxID=3075376 RepID=UPI002AD4B58A|nr:hypothetical protein [Nostoc sp. ChiQUE01b]MDZ8262361.1 hypothetical protein [Nostoc sp. ChiQUE01b]
MALPAGTVFVTKTVAVGKKNNLVSASAMPAAGYAYALIYPDSQGTVKQETIPTETLLIRGRGQQPLIAKKLTDVGTNIAQQDLLVGLVFSHFSDVAMSATGYTYAQTQNITYCKY